MFGELLKRLIVDTPEPLGDADAHLALASLLVRVARADGHFAPVEADRIRSILKRRYDLTDDDTDALLQDAKILESEAPDTVRFTKAIKDAVPFEQREDVVELLWELVLADGERNHEEDGLLRLVAQLLGVNDRDSALARRRVADRLG